MSLFGPNIEKLKAKRDIEGLINALHDKNDRVRREAAEALGEIGGTIDMPEYAVVIVKLIDTLDDKSNEVHDASSQALGKIGARAVQSLITAVKVK